jgi:hypothetical protein
VKKRLYIQRLSELTGVEEKYFLTGTAEKSQETSPRRTKGNPAHIEKKLVGALANYPALIPILREKEVIQHIRDENIHEVLTKMFQYVEEKKHLDITDFVSLLERTELRDFVVETAFDMTGCDETESKQILSDYLRHIERKRAKEDAQRITERLSDAERRGNEGEVMELLEQKRQVLAFIKSNFI